MSDLQSRLPTLPDHPFRLDVPLHDLLQQPSQGPTPNDLRELKELPVPVFPQHPELLRELHEADLAIHEEVVRTGKRHWPPRHILKTMRGWMFPYFKSRLLPGDFQPIIAYLFTEWKCNLDCHYCWSYDNRVKGMSEDTARRAIDWLHSTPCRVLAPTGGEPLLRPEFVHKVVYYAAKKDF
jgi:sulfatase maturation enzyme AslB (radical SAM superfamily)